MTEQARQWPGNICSGKIHYAPAHNYNGFYLADVEHGIPTIGSVSPTDPVTIRGQSVHVFNYPEQTEQIAAQLVHRWNAFSDLVKALEEIAAIENKDFGPDWEEIEEARKIANDVLGRVKSMGKPNG